MKTSILTAFVVATLCVNSAFATAPSQTKPASKTMTTTVKKSTPVKSTATTKAVHKKHVKTSE
ncbi:hypothetical protein [Spirosoma fluviale]|uniref:Uncharacterized protein n=1 Tax=Spirosoma fluviale TaxID=1597977 RepID=A0A286FAC2_9BACT|nr:hypothetical protein [Spirosoma fluviale]SOD80152.1 hypothetical protein SAMN06269250_1259 [Spirosoma fluviale]